MAAPSSPYLAGLTTSYFLFPRMKLQLWQRHFQDIIEIQEQLLTLLHAVPKCQFLQCFHSGRNTLHVALTQKGITLKGTAMFKEMSSTHYFMTAQELLDTPLHHTKWYLSQKLYLKFVLFIHICIFSEIQLWFIVTHQIIPTF